MSLVFVYGTLKNGHGNHGLLEGCPFLGEAVTVRKYAIRNAGFPVLIESKVHALPVLGELYEVDETTRRRLDRLEREGVMYNRVRGKVIAGHGTVQANYYVGVPKFWQTRKIDLEASLNLYKNKQGYLEWK